jgi:hypothetical protein
MALSARSRISGWPRLLAEVTSPLPLQPSCRRYPPTLGQRPLPSRLRFDRPRNKRCDNHGCAEQGSGREHCRGGLSRSRSHSSPASWLGKTEESERHDTFMRDANRAKTQIAFVATFKITTQLGPCVISLLITLLDRLSQLHRLPSLRLTSRTISSIWNGCKRLGSFSKCARHFAKTLSVPFFS